MSVYGAIASKLWASLAEQREDALRKAAIERLPRGLRWAVDHPRLLRILYRIRRKWSPTVVVGVDWADNSGTTVKMVRRKDGSVVLLASETFEIR